MKLSSFHFLVVCKLLPVVAAEFCCSQRFDSCTFNSGSWCGRSSSNCKKCNGMWMDSFQSNCAPRWTGCSNKACCSPGTCTNQNGWWGCELLEDPPPPPAPTSPSPTKTPTKAPTLSPTTTPNNAPTTQPTDAPTEVPSVEPSIPPTLKPGTPTPAPTSSPTKDDVEPPSVQGSEHPSSSPSVVPSKAPTARPTSSPTEAPTESPTAHPTVDPTVTPTASPISSGDEAFVPADYSERITVPHPVEPILDSPRSNCPHFMPGLKSWHSMDTWPNGIPDEDESFTLPENSQIVVLQSVEAKLGTVTIPASSSLIIGENEDGISLDADGFVVEGELVIGSETCRIEQPVIITLHGSRPNDATVSASDPKVKGIAVTGKLHLHGKRFFRTWSRLASTASVGDTVVYLQHEVNWEPGQEIVLVTTAMKDSREWHQNEQLSIASLDPNPPLGCGTMVHLTEPLQFSHIANLSYQAEVGLLSRAILIQGSPDDSLPTDPDPLDCQASYNRFGDRAAPCPYSEITGYGGHIVVLGNGVGYVEGVELFRMGQTNVLGRYPMHFHLLGDNCPGCYFRESSVHQSFYRCLSIHGTNKVTATENVAYDITGYCFYLEDGIEVENEISFNLAAHIHAIGPEPPHGGGQKTPTYIQSDQLTLPADVTAAGFYITNMHNSIVGNAASGGWAGFAFPMLETPLQSFRYEDYSPSKTTTIALDGNTAHSAGWWFGSAGAFYFGGNLYYRNDGLLEYNPGRSGSRNVCVNACKSCKCESAWLRMTNNKAFLSAGVGLNSWSGRMEVIGFESHDNGLSLESLSDGFWVNNLLAICRTGETLVMPSLASPKRMEGDGFFWYDTNQEHIITESTFRNCGYRSEEFDQYNSSPSRGCGDNTMDTNGCSSRSTVFGFLTHSDQFNPEIMQGTRGIHFENCGRRFYLRNHRGDNLPDTVSGRGQNWLDVDGSVSGFGEPTLIGSGLTSVQDWWSVDANVVYDPQGPLHFIKKNDGPERGLAHFKVTWDDSIHSQVGGSICGNGSGVDCPIMGYMRHAGELFTGGVPVTAAGDIVGPVGGYSWILDLNNGSPRTVKFDLVEVLPDTPLLVTIPYPAGTTFTISANGASWCNSNNDYSCYEEFTEVNTLDEVRHGPGNQYYVDSTSNAVTFRIVRLPHTYVGAPAWEIPQLDTPGKYGKGWAMERFERDGVLLPKLSYGPHYLLQAHNCGGNSGVYCTNPVAPYHPTVCNDGFEQVSYDKCCLIEDPSFCIYARDAQFRRNLQEEVGSSSSMAPYVWMAAFLLIPVMF